MLALLSGVMYILSGENLAGMYSTTRRLREEHHTGRQQATEGRDPMHPIAPSSFHDVHCTIVHYPWRHLAVQYIYYCT